jgi:hypothetical protein
MFGADQSSSVATRWLVRPFSTRTAVQCESGFVIDPMYLAGAAVGVAAAGYFFFAGGSVSRPNSLLTTTVVALLPCLRVVGGVPAAVGGERRGGCGEPLSDMCLSLFLTCVLAGRSPIHCTDDISAAHSLCNPP